MVFDGVMRIAVISDTHGLLRPEALSGLAGVEHIIHAGDIGSVEIVPRLREIAPVTAIRGNVDTQAWASAFHERETVKLAGRTIYVIHDLGELDLHPLTAGFRPGDIRAFASSAHRNDLRRPLRQSGQRRAAAV